MQVKRIFLVALAVMMAALSACTAAGTNIPTATPQATATGTAQPTNTPTPPDVPVTGGTAAPVPPEVSVTSPTNCRTGPSTAYALVFTANPGTQYAILGAYTGSNYWIIQNPSGGSCWLWGQYAVVTGSTVGLPTFTAPALASQPPVVIETAPPTIIIETLPSSPSGLSGSRTCEAGTRGTMAIWIETVTLTWNASSNQNGYHVFKGNTQIATLAAGATRYSTVIRYAQAVGSPLSDNYSVEAFNSFGASSRPSIQVARCP